MNSWISILQALLTPTIGIIAAYVAWQQYRLAKQKHDIDIFNRRMQVYKVTVVLLVKCERTYSISEDDFYEWRRDVADAEFLFGQEILDLFEDIERTSAEVIRSDEENPRIAMNDRNEVVSINIEAANLFEDFLSFRRRASQLFAPYFQTFLKLKTGRSKVNYNEMLQKEEHDLEKTRKNFPEYTATDEDIPF